MSLPLELITLLAPALLKSFTHDSAYNSDMATTTMQRLHLCSQQCHGNDNDMTIVTTCPPHLHALTSPDMHGYPLIIHPHHLAQCEWPMCPTIVRTCWSLCVITLPICSPSCTLVLPMYMTCLPSFALASPDVQMPPGPWPILHNTVGPICCDSKIEPPKT